MSAPKLADNLVFVYTLNQSMHWFMIGLAFPVMILIILDKGVDIIQAGMAVATYSATTFLLEITTQVGPPTSSAEGALPLALPA